MGESSRDVFSVLDGVALVAGAAVSSVHLRGVLAEDLFGPGWLIMLGTFFWVGLTSAGPFLYLLRRFVRGLPDYPKVGDRLWAILGIPWLLTAFLQAVPPHPGLAAAADELSALLLMVGIGIASMIALGFVWTTWVIVDRQRASVTFSASWTNRVGLLLAIAWPVQCGVGLVVIG